MGAEEGGGAADIGGFVDIVKLSFSLRLRAAGTAGPARNRERLLFPTSPPFGQSCLNREFAPRGRTQPMVCTPPCQATSPLRHKPEAPPKVPRWRFGLRP